MNKQKIISLIFLYIAISGFNTSCRKNESYVKAEGMIWNTVYHITYKGKPELKDSILPVLNEVGKSLSVFDKSSLVSELNRSESMEGDRHMLKVYDASVSINKLSKGKFDPTVSPLVDAWGFGRGHEVTRDTLAIDSILTFIGIQKTHRDGDVIIKDDIRTQFNFSAIAKGYGCDALGEMFKRNSVADYMVEIGGEICLNGKSPSGKDWKIAVDAPVEGKNPGEETAMILSLTDVGIATSGNYRNYRIEGNQKVAHTISPLTGRPFIGEILSATVVASDCMQADGIATACMASTLQEAQDLLGIAGVEGMLITQDSIWTTKGFEKYVISEDAEP